MLEHWAWLVFLLTNGFLAGVGLARLEVWSFEKEGKKRERGWPALVLMLLVVLYAVTFVLGRERLHLVLGDGSGEQGAVVFGIANLVGLAFDMKARWAS